jgi:hypothetical protein
MQFFLRFVISGLLAAFSCLGVAAVDVSVTPGPWDLFKGTSKVSTHDSEAACAKAAGDRGATATYTCRTRTGVVVKVLPPALACGVADIGGWTVPKPSAFDASIPLRDMKQPGSRLHYISAATGSDSTGRLYFWDGQQIVDQDGKATDAAGAAYGTDPMNPTAAVKPFRRWSWVGPRRSATSDIGSRGEMGSAFGAFRAGFPDWWLFRRTETFDLTDDFLSFERETNPAAQMVYASLAVTGGRSATERQIVGAYGDLCGARPRFVHPQLGFVSRHERAGFPTLKHVAYLSLHFDGHDRAVGKNFAGVTLLYQTASAIDILLEDIWFDATTISIGGANGAQVTARRVIVTDNYATDGSHVQGVYYDGSRAGVFRIEESILMRNGFARGDPKTMPWPPSGAQIWDHFNRNLYINGETDFARSGLFDSVSMLGASGDQFRPGGLVLRNFFYQGYVSLGARGGYPDADGPTGKILDNVLQRFTATGTDMNTGHPGWGIGVSGGSFAVEVARNVVTGAQHPAKWWGVAVSPINQDCYAPAKLPTRSTRIRGNIVDAGTAQAAINVTDGTTNPCFGLVLPGVRDTVVSDNVLITDKLREGEFTPVGAAVGTVPDTVFQANKVYPTRAAAALALGFPAPDRTLKTYMQSRGVAVASSDGFPEWFSKATGQRRGQWRPEWTARPLVNYFRDGFAMPALAGN